MEKRLDTQWRQFYLYVFHVKTFFLTNQNFFQSFDKFLFPITFQKNTYASPFTFCSLSSFFSLSFFFLFFFFFFFLDYVPITSTHVQIIQLPLSFSSLSLFSSSFSLFLLFFSSLFLLFPLFFFFSLSIFFSIPPFLFSFSSSSLPPSFLFFRFRT